MYRTSAASVRWLPGVRRRPRCPRPAGASGVSAKVTPNRGLVGGQSVTVSGRGLAVPPAGSP